MGVGVPKRLPKILGTPAGCPGTGGLPAAGVPVVYFRRTTIVAGTPAGCPRRHPAVQGAFSEILCDFSHVPCLLPNTIPFFGGGGESVHQRCFQLPKLKCLNRQTRGLVYTKKLVLKGKEGENIYTKEPSRCVCVCVWGTSSHSIGV